MMSRGEMVATFMLLVTCTTSVSTLCLILAKDNHTIKPVAVTAQMIGGFEHHGSFRSSMLWTVERLRDALKDKDNHKVQHWANRLANEVTEAYGEENLDDVILRARNCNEVQVQALNKLASTITANLEEYRILSEVVER